MTSVTRNISFDADILKAAERHKDQHTKESLSGLVQRAIRELLEREGAWPPKEK